MSEIITPNKKALEEALELSNEILKNIELSDISLTNVALKVSRLARLLNDFEMQEILKYEVSGYPSTPGGLPQNLYKLAVMAGREFSKEERANYGIQKVTKKYVYIESISELEEELRNTEAYINAAREPDNPPVPIRKFVLGSEIEMPSQTSIERKTLRAASAQKANKLASRKNLIYQYALRKHYELKFSGIADDIFSRIRERVDSKIGTAIPEAVKRFTAVYENLRSDNPEDWSNAVHSCRRILQDVADAVFPTTNETREVNFEGKSKVIKLGKENYINRIIAFVEDKTSSMRFRDIVGSHISFFGHRLDSIVEAANKGSHDLIVSREEADRYVVYTYLLIGDVLSYSNSQNILVLRLTLDITSKLA